MIRLSVIVPCYNPGPLLKHCLSALLTSRPVWAEILLVDDGSTDGAVAEALLVSQEPLSSGALRVIRQANGGLSAARNAGLREARGDLIAFVDADDVVHQRWFEDLAAAFDTGADIVEFGFQRFPNEALPAWPDTPAELVPGSVASAFKAASWYAWARAYRRDVLPPNGFPVRRYYEDLMTVPHAYLRSRQIVRITAPRYGYRVNPKGITENLKPAYLRDLAEYFVWLLPLPGELLDLHRLGVLRQLRELEVMMGADTYASFVSDARRYLSKDAWRIAKRLDQLFWFSPRLFSAFVRLRTWRAHWRRRDQGTLS